LIINMIASFHLHKCIKIDYSSKYQFFEKANP